MSISSFVAAGRKFVTNVGVAAPIFGAKMKDSIKYSQAFDSGLRVGIICGALGGLAGYCVGFTAEQKLAGTWANPIIPHAISIGTVVGTYAGYKFAEIVDPMISDWMPQAPLQKGLVTSRVIVLPFALTQYAAKTTSAIALATIYCGKEILNGASWVIKTAAESYRQATLQNI